MPMDLLLAMNPPFNEINQLHKLFAKFFWENATRYKNKNWVSWGSICYPKEKRGLGFRSLHNVSKALFAKLCWNFRKLICSLWSGYMWYKYCKKLHETITTGGGALHVLTKMLIIMEEVKHNICWQINVENPSFNLIIGQNWDTSYIFRGIWPWTKM